MSGRGYLVALGFLAVLSWTGLGLIIANVNPSALVARVLFFVLLYLAVAATSGLVAYALSFRLFASKAFRGNLGRSLQHGWLWAAFAVAAAALQLFRMLSWVNGGLMIGLLAVGEFLLLARQHQDLQPGTRRARRWEETNS